jgi:hypothetical protein
VCRGSIVSLPVGCDTMLLIISCGVQLSLICDVIFYAGWLSIMCDGSHQPCQWSMMSGFSGHLCSFFVNFFKNCWHGLIASGDTLILLVFYFKTLGDVCYTMMMASLSFECNHYVLCPCLLSHKMSASCRTTSVC